MIELILPGTVAAAETRTDPGGVTLFDSEERIVANAVEKRRREFTTARWCARQALVKLGLPESPISSGEKREPLWPDGVVGAITHCQGYRAAALALSKDVEAIGIDAEPNEPCPDGVLRTVSSEPERAMIDRLTAPYPETSWDRLLFSAKESVYKAWFPLTHRWLGFEDAELTLSPDGTFTARLLVDGPYPAFPGRWLTAGGLVLTAITR